MRELAIMALAALLGGCHWIFPYSSAGRDGPPVLDRAGGEGDRHVADRQPPDLIPTIVHSTMWQLGSVVPLDSLNTQYEEDENYLSADGQTIYFSRRRDLVLDKEIYEATRQADGQFGDPRPLLGLNSVKTDCFSMTADGLVGFLVTSRVNGPYSGTIDVWIGTRTLTTTPWVSAMFKPDTVLSTPDDDWDVFSSLDGLRVWYSPQVHTSPPPQKILFSERPSRDKPFSPPTVVTELGSDVADATLSADERLIVLKKNVSGNCGDLYYAVRASTSGPFSTPEPIPSSEINTPDCEGEPFLSADGKELYFASDRPNGKGLDDLYRVKIVMLP